VTGRVTVVGLGPSGPDLVTAGTLAEIERVPVRYLRTTRHPSAPVVLDAGASSFDELYESAERIDDVYAGIVDTLVDAAGRHGEVLYAVPGSPRVAERTVELLAAHDGVDVVVHPALSFIDLAEVKLAADDGPRVTVLHHLGLPDEHVFEVDWAELDRSFDPDHLTSVWIPELARPLDAFTDLVRTLRERCPWDAEQTHHTLTRHLLEETYEVLEAIEALDEATGAGYDHVEEELGDLLFQVVFHATIASERDAFTLDDVARGIHDKLVHRHPHVFAGVEVAGPDEVVRNWEQLKKAEKGRTSVMDGIPGDLPALLYAHKVLRKAASLGIELEAGTGVAVASDPDLGSQLLRLVDAARRAELDPEAALRAAAARVRDDAIARELG
jgi:tetrapyrrole methylase family protein/MazG family protein